jgi:predicted ATPase
MFDIKTAEDFYAALVADFDDFMDEPDSARRALHSVSHRHPIVRICDSQVARATPVSVVMPCAST